MSDRVKLEICCGDLSSVLQAKAGGANRIELCSGLSEGGLTPSLGLLRAALVSDIPEINVLIRPRQGDFLYTGEERALIEDDIKTAVREGATGIVIGALTPEGDVDKETMKRLIGAARDCLDKVNITFHRAFDVARDYEKSLEDIIELGCDTLLTSGMAPDAYSGIETLRKIVKKSAGEIVIMAGGGINPGNVNKIIEYTGVNAVHSTARKMLESKMEFRRNDVSMGAGCSDEYGFLSTDSATVSKLLQLIQQ